ncbi:MAG: ATP phosphoribosyltransferase regulatory subunit [Congregibacter sp.]
MTKRSSDRPWQLPDGIDELLPDAAAHVEGLRRLLLDCAASWGYQLVIPPMVEFTDSLLVGVGEDLDLLTFKMPDQLTGRMLGVRADMTPQVARIDAHSLAGETLNRLCYVGSTLHTRARSLAASRSPLQLGAELFGDASLAGDVEVMDLMLSMLEAVGIEVGSELTLDLGHGDVFRQVLAASGAEAQGLDAAVFDALQRKSRPDLEPLLQSLPEASAAGLRALLEMHGDLSVLDRAEAQFAQSVPAAAGALGDLRKLAQTMQARHPSLSIYIDLAELRGYHYHTGVVFAVYAQSLGEALARGGRYDNVGEVYGRARPATGFATDLRLLATQLLPGDGTAAVRKAISAPDAYDESLDVCIRRLRNDGETVIVALGGRMDPRCDWELVSIDGQWITQRRSLAPEGKI